MIMMFRKRSFQGKEKSSQFFRAMVKAMVLHYCGWKIVETPTTMQLAFGIENKIQRQSTCPQRSAIADGA